MKHSIITSLTAALTLLFVTVGHATTHQVDYRYDVLNRLSEVISAEGSTSYTYDAVGNQASITYPNGTSTAYYYDSNNRLIDQTTTDAQGLILTDYHYTLDASGRRLSLDEASGRTTDWTYDTSYRLTDEQITDPQTGTYNANYEYDQVGNRIYDTVDGVETQYTYDDNDRLLQQGGTTYIYDANGNTLTETLDGSTATYTYDDRNRLIGVTTLAGDQLSYEYDANGVRQSKTENGTTTNYLVDPNRAYAQVLKETDDLNTEQVIYVHGDDLISQNRPNDTGTSYYHTDGLGSTRLLTDNTGQITDSYEYEAFGQELASSESTENNYRYTGEQYDPALGQYYLRARYYDPSQGRFTQQDTWMGNSQDPVTLHKYLYANVDPANVADPSGNFGITETGVTLNIANTLTSLQIDNAFHVFDELGIDDSRIATARVINKIWGLASMGAAGFGVWKILSKKSASSIDSIAKQVGDSRAFVFVNSGSAAQISRNGFVSASELRRFVPTGVPNIFTSSARISTGEKYQFVVGKNNVELKWHSADSGAAAKFPNSPAGLGWTAQIKMNGKLLGADGKWYSKPNALTHIPVVD